MKHHGKRASQRKRKSRVREFDLEFWKLCHAAFPELFPSWCRTFLAKQPK